MVVRRAAERAICKIGLYGPARGAYQRVFNRSYWRQRQLVRSRYAPFVGPGDLVFDIGANEGRISEALAELGGRVVAIEPNPSLVSVLDARYGSILHAIEPVAVGEEPGCVTLWLGADPAHSTISSDWAAGHPERWRGTADVEVVTLASLCDKYGSPAFIKIDVEAAEDGVLRGLDHAIPALSFEVQAAKPDVALDCLAILELLGPYEFCLMRSQSTFPERWSFPEQARDLIAQLAADSPRAYGDMFARHR